MTPNEEQDVIRRLENWARCLKERPKQCCSPMFKNMDVEPEPKTYNKGALPLYDFEDAGYVTQVWLSLPMGRIKTYLQHRYALGIANKNKLCFSLGITRKEHKILRKRAHECMYKRLFVR